MSNLGDKIKKDLIAAMKSGDTQKRDVLRMLDSMIKNEEITKSKREKGLSEDEVSKVLGRAVKQRKDSVSQYQKGGRNDLAEKEQKEIDILVKYLPEQISGTELEKIVKNILAEMNIQNKNEFGKVMGAIMSKVNGRADGNAVRKVVEENLKYKDI